jgi:hypothetical protein
VGLPQYFHVEGSLTAKIIIDSGGVDPGKIANLPRRRMFETLFGEYEAGSFEKAAAGPMVRGIENFDTPQVCVILNHGVKIYHRRKVVVKYKFKV